MTQEAHSNCRFYVEVNGIPQAVFTEVSGLQVETTLMDYEEGGNNGFVHRLPSRTKVGNVTLKRGMTKSNEFYKWYMETVSGKASRRNVSVIMYDSTGVMLCRWNFDKAFPVKWVGPQLSADGKNVAIETLELAHSGLSTT
jgi:phage tail-like protein